MNKIRTRSRRLILVVLFPVALLAAGSAVSAQTGGVYTLVRFTTAPGGAAGSGSFNLAGAAGQPEAGRSTGGGFTLNGGYEAEAPFAGTPRAYLPVLRR